MNYLTTYYIEQLAPVLEGFKKLREGVYNFKCPLCGDSETNSHKKRGYILQKKDKWFFYCHNCGTSLFFDKFLKTVDEPLYEEMKKDEFQNSRITQSTPIVKAKKWILERSHKIIPINQLSETHKAVVYLKKRCIPSSSMKDVYWCDDFPSLIHNQMGSKYEHTKLPLDGILFKLYKKDKSFNGYQIRSIDPKVPKSQRFLICLHDDEKSYFGIERINPNETVYITEGCIDSLCITNCIAMLNASLWHLHYPDTVYINDCEPRNQSVCRQIEECIDKDYSVVLLPMKYEGMDINDLVKTYHYSSDELKSLFAKYTYKGLMAKAIFSMWRK